LKTSPYAVHLNHKEAKDFAKIGSDLNSQMKAITAGADGLYLTKGETTIHAKCTIEKVHSATGSGDCLLAGLAVSFKRGLSLEEMAQLGAACGSANCMREDLGMIYKSDVEELVKKMEVTPLISDRINA